MSHPSILVTGHTGNVGSGVVHELDQLGVAYATTTREQARSDSEVYFDFLEPAATLRHLPDFDAIFLMRPPPISDVKRYFKPLLAGLATREQRPHIVFLSVQGAENVSFIPHAKIEREIVAAGLPYTFLRPSYFMQNLTGPLLPQIREKQKIVLPSGKANFLWIDALDIGACVAHILMQSAEHRNQAYTLTGTELLNFQQVAELLSEVLGRRIAYTSQFPLWFLFAQARRTNWSQAVVMTALHTLPRFQSEPEITPLVEKLIGRKPTLLRTFLEREKAVFE
ncbi:MAG: NmrA family NAD(P)-binding protein [Bacteroidota bacterium]